MKKFFMAVSVVAFLVACDDSSSASADNNEPTTLSSAEEQGSSFSSKPASSESVSSSSSFDKSLSSSSSSVVSSRSEENNSSSSKIGCKTESEDKCEYGELIDDRDGQIYKTVKIGDQWWMAENLNYETANSFCYDDDASNCTKYGRLYTWVAAMDSAGTWSVNGKGCGYGTTCSPMFPVRGVCPDGWHLPSKDEWNILFNAVDSFSGAGSKLSDSGVKLRSTSGWSRSGNGTDDFSFSALPAGYWRHGEGYYSEGYRAYFWSSSEEDSYGAYSMVLYDNIDRAYQEYDHKNNELSVRCVKN